MRLIGTIPDEAPAKRFGNYLNSVSIRNQIDQDAVGHWGIWILEEDNIKAAGACLSEFFECPDNPKFVQTVKQKQPQIEDKTPKGSRRKRFRIMDGRTVFYAAPVRLGILSITLIAMTFCISLLSELGKNDRLIQPLSITEYQDSGDYYEWSTGLIEIRHGQLWRLFTPMFLHFGILHLLFNMLWLKDLGSMIEARKSTWMLLIMILILSGVSNLVQFFISGPAFGGMSGVVYGLLGYIWMQGKFNPSAKLTLNPQTVQMMIIWFFVCMTGIVGPIANGAHAAGAGMGIAWGFLESKWSAWRRHH